MIAASALTNLAIYSAQVAIVTAVASMLPGLLRLDNPGARYAYWRAVGLLCLALPWIQPYLEPASTLSGTTGTTGTGAMGTGTGTTGSRTAPAPGATGSGAGAVGSPGATGTGTGTGSMGGTGTGSAGSGGGR